ncbi:uncharacterized protein TNCT_170431 [Trichonephila clavata]|uniref:Uncharacterized protein n=1 Tax=Trichonephila clavata TaxID=2740835 RepID=A0A8X6I6N6_TRICU|nr:uncharacterized protein TNCT_170431 [Trichonephila clavata]
MTSIIEPGSLVSENSDQSVIMEDISASPTLTDQDRCNSLRGFEKQHHIFDARKDYVVSMLDIEKKIPSPTDETKTKLEDELKGLEVKLKFLQGKMNEFLPCPIAHCTHNYKFKALKRAAEPILRPGKLTAVVNKNLKTKNINIKNGDFSFPKKTAKPVPVENKTNQINTTNSFAVLNTAKSDAEDVTLPQSKIKPIMMRMTSSYNLILQSINRTHPTAINTHINGRETMGDTRLKLAGHILPDTGDQTGPGRLAYVARGSSYWQDTGPREGNAPISLVGPWPRLYAQCGRPIGGHPLGWARDRKAARC